MTNALALWSVCCSGFLAPASGAGLARPLAPAAGRPTPGPVSALPSLSLAPSPALTGGLLAASLPGLAPAAPAPSPPRADLFPTLRPAAPESTPPEAGSLDLLRAPLWKPTGACDALVDLGPGMRPPGSQGRGNTCSVFAAAALGEYLIKRRTGTDMDISERFLYYVAKRDFTDDPELRVYKTVDGLAGFVAVEALNGPILEERWWPYGDGSVPSSADDAGSGGQTELAAGFDGQGPYYALGGRVLRGRPPYEEFTGAPPAGAEARARKDHAFRPVAIDRRRIKDYLAVERAPVAFNIMVYFDAVDHRTGKLREPTEAEVRRCRQTREGCGGHVILITGYDPGTREYIFRNSWGPSWGRGGYGRLPEDYVVDHCEMCGHLDGLPGMSRDDRSMVVNGVHGWSAELQ